MDSDIISEWAYGKGAIQSMGTFIVMDVGKDKPGPLICGGVWTPLLDGLKQPKENKGGFNSTDELWVAQLIIIPILKFNSPKLEGWVGLNLDQKIATDWGNTKKWNQIFP